MNRDQLKELLAQIKSGTVNVDEGLDRLRTLPFEASAEATIDHHRSLRQGMSEVIYGEGKSAEQIEAIMRTLRDGAGDDGIGDVVLATRVSEDKAKVLCAAFPEAIYRPAARTLRMGARAPRDGLTIGILTAGTSDVPVATEAQETLTALGLATQVVNDVGVAGLHRLLGRLPELEQCQALIVVAGMEGALPSVVGGLVACPVVAVPTSTGYGAALGGLTALMGMLTSCASGVTVVNIDNGFGAAMAAHRIVTLIEKNRNA